MKIRSAEEIEDIELAWHGTAQHALSHVPEARAGAGLAGFAGAGLQAAEPQVAEPPRVETIQAEGPAGRPVPVEPAAAAKPEGRKRGRPRKVKAEDEAVGEKKAATEAKPEAAPAGKKQKSLFDF